MNKLKLVIVGHVDHGKSTLVGRLLHETGALPRGQGRGGRIAMTGEQQKRFGIDRLNVPRSSIPAVMHVDYSARVQTVHRETNAKYYALIERFKEKTGCPVIVNTSFNVRGEPIVGSPEDAFRCFMGKEHQNPALKQNYEPGSSSTKAPAMEHVELAPPRIERAKVGT